MKARALSPVLAVIALATAGCGASEANRVTAPPRLAPSEPPGDENDYAARISLLQAELDQRLAEVAAGSGPDQALASDASAQETPCDAAATLRDRIGELSQRICEIAAEQPHDVDLERKCLAGAKAYSEATERVSHACR